VPRRNKERIKNSGNLLRKNFHVPLCFWVRNQKVGDVSPKGRIGVSQLGINLTPVIGGVSVLVAVRRQISLSANADAIARRAIAYLMIACFHVLLYFLVGN
jgi:hypothetical protein